MNLEGVGKRLRWGKNAVECAHLFFWALRCTYGLGLAIS